MKLEDFYDSHYVTMKKMYIYTYIYMDLIRKR